MARIYYGLALVLTGVWAFFTPEAFTDFLTDYSRGMRIVGDTVVFLAVSQCILAIPAWLAFWAWRRSNPTPSITSRLPIYWVAAVASLFTWRHLLAEFGISIVIATILANALVALCLYSPTENTGGVEADPCRAQKLPADLSNSVTIKAKTPQSLRIIPQAMLNELPLYLNFVVNEGDIRMHPSTDKTYRINSNGLAVDLTKWHFDNNTGQFYRITQRIKSEDNYLFTPTPYSKRYVQFHSRGFKFIVILVNVTGFGMTAAGVALALCAIPAAELLRPWVIGLSLVMLVTGCSLLIGRKDYAEEKVVGPQPFEMRRQDFASRGSCNRHGPQMRRTTLLTNQASNAIGAVGHGFQCNEKALGRVGRALAGPDEKPAVPPSGSGSIAPPAHSWRFRSRKVGTVLPWYYGWARGSRLRPFALGRLPSRPIDHPSMGLSSPHEARLEVARYPLSTKFLTAFVLAYVSFHTATDQTDRNK